MTRNVGWLAPCALVLGPLIPFLSARPCPALEPGRPLTQYALSTWQSAHGLPNNHVSAILQTTDGYLWLGTEEGLARFDGARFSVFDPDNTPALHARSIVALAEDPSGALWIGTEGGGLARFSREEWTSYTTADGLDSDHIRSLALGRDGSLWISTTAGLMRLRDGRFARVVAMGGLATRSLLEDDLGRLWLGGTGGLVRLDSPREGGAAFVRYTARDGLASDEVQALCRGREGALWIGTTKGLTRLHEGSFTTYGVAEGLATSVVLSVLEDPDGAVWVGTDGAGLARYRAGRFETLSSHQGLASNLVDVVHLDRGGLLWLGTNGGGLHRLRDGKFLIYTSQEGLASDVAWSVHEDPQGTLWVGTQGGLSGLRPDGERIRYTRAEGLADPSVVSVTSTGDGSLWIGTRAGGLQRLRRGALTTYTRRDGLASDEILSLYADADGSLWIGSRSGPLTQWRDGTFTIHSGDGAPPEKCMAIQRTRDGSLWVGTRVGLFRLADGAWRRYSERDGLPSETVASLYEDAEGALWIGTFRGLARYREGRFRAYGKGQGFPEGGIWSLIEDRGGDIWISTNKGIFRISRRSIAELLETGGAGAVTAVRYSTSDGLKSQEFSGAVQPVVWRGRDGRLWFPSYLGVVVIDPERVPTNREPPPVFIEQVVIDRRPASASVVLEQPPGHGELEFHYTGVGLSAAEKVRFRYRLEGFESDWVEAGSRRSAYYTNIPPGRYRFQVTACNEDGVWNEQGASVPLRLLPHFYQTVWFRGACGLGLALLALLAHLLRVGRLAASERELRRRVQESLAQIKVLGGLIPVCAWCKKIRDDSGYWNQMEAYIRDHSQANFTHGICPDCMNAACQSVPPPAPPLNPDEH